MKNNKKILLAFSGGLDTSFCVPFLIDQGYEVITIIVDTGGFTEIELKNIAEKSKKLGAKKHYSINATTQLYKKFATYIIKANYLKGGTYPACVGPERLIIAEEIGKIAKAEKLTTIAHGSTGCGNDQIRFEITLKSIIPNCQIIAPIRDNSLSRENEVQFLQKKGIETPNTTKSYSINKGLLGTTISGKETLNTWEPLPNNAFPQVKEIDKTPTTPTNIEIEFKEGLPIKLNKKQLTGETLIKELSQLAADQGFGKDYHIGTTIIGLKGRIGFEAPAMKVLIKTHSELEKTILTSKQIFWKQTLGTLYGDMIHEGLYFDPLVKNLEAFLDSASKPITGTIKANIYKGALEIISIKSKNSLFNKELGIYGEETESWSGQDMKSFCKIYGLESTNSHITQQS